MPAAKEDKVWHVDVNGKPHGPYSTRQIRAGLEQNKIDTETLIFGPGMTKWEPVGWNPLFIGSQPAELPRATYHRSALAHEIDFVVRGEEMQFVEIELDPEESTIAEAGSMMYMDDAIDMETIFGDGQQDSGLASNLMGAGKRLLTGESLFMTVFTNRGRGKKRLAFAAPYPGKILPVNLAEMGGSLTCQKDAFLCAAKGVAIDIEFQKKLGVGLFGGEGFIMQRLRGDGLAFLHAGGTIVSRELQDGEALKVDTGCLVALEPSVQYDIQFVGNIKSAIFGGEGIFFALLRGPGTVWLQSMPFSRLAGRMLEAAPQGGGRNSGEGSLLGEVSRLFER